MAHSQAEYVETTFQDDHIPEKVRMARVVTTFGKNRAQQEVLVQIGCAPLLEACCGGSRGTRLDISRTLPNSGTEMMGLKKNMCAGQDTSRRSIAHLFANTWVTIGRHFIFLDTVTLPLTTRAQEEVMHCSCKVFWGPIMPRDWDPSKMNDVLRLKRHFTIECVHSLGAVFRCARDASRNTRTWW